MWKQNERKGSKLTEVTLLSLLTFRSQNLKAYLAYQNLPLYRCIYRECVKQGRYLRSNLLDPKIFPSRIKSDATLTLTLRIQQVVINHIPELPSSRVQIHITVIYLTSHSQYKWYQCRWFDGQYFINIWRKIT